jgi:tetratricopeptide (TPR) repeat protein
MKRIVLAGVLALLSGVTGLVAQQKQPAPKSPKEVEALQAMFGAQDPDSRIKLAQELLTKFADTEFNGVAMYLITVSYEQKGDFTNMIIWGERTIATDPKNYPTMLILAGGISKSAQEHDLDLEEKLTRADKYAHSAMDILATAEKPNPQLTDEQWASTKKDLTSQAHEAFGVSAVLRKKYDLSIAEFKQAVEGAATPDPTTQIRLARVYNVAGKPDDAIALLDKVMASSDVPVSIKQFAQAERVRAIQAKGGPPKPPATPPAPAAAPAAAPPATPAATPAPAAPKN